MGALREYETVFVLHPSLEESRVEEEIEAVRKTIEAGSGEVLAVDRWGRRKLAYEVKKVHEGIYTLIRFRSGVDVLRELDRRYRFQEQVLRHLTVVAQGPLPEPRTPETAPSGTEETPAESRPAAASETTSSAAPEAGSGATEPAREEAEPPATPASEKPAEDAPEDSTESRS